MTLAAFAAMYCAHDANNAIDYAPTNAFELAAATRTHNRAVWLMLSHGRILIAPEFLKIYFVQSPAHKRKPRHAGGSIQRKSKACEDAMRA